MANDYIEIFMGNIFTKTVKRRLLQGTMIGVAGLVAIVTPAIAQESQPAGYLPGVGVDLLQVLPPAPEPGTPRYDADRRTFRETRKLLGTPRGEQAVADVRLDVPTMLADFSPAAGRRLTPESNPALTLLLRRMQPDIEAPVKAAKAVGHRLRPFHLDKGEICQSRDMVPDFDYPSGHASWGTSVALVLAELIPDRVTEILTRGREYGDSRYICGAHNLSAVEAGRFGAASTVARLHGDAGFRHDLDAAREELAR